MECFPIRYVHFSGMDRKIIVVRICYTMAVIIAIHPISIQRSQGWFLPIIVTIAVGMQSFQERSVYSQRANLQLLLMPIQHVITGLVRMVSSSLLKDPYIAGIPMTGAGVYTLTVDNGLGCSDTDEKTINVIQSPVVDAGTNLSLLGGDTISLNGTVSGGSPPYNSTWSPSQSVSNANVLNPQAFPLASTQYILTVTGIDGCVGSDNVNITVIPSTRFPDSWFTTTHSLTALPGVTLYLENNIGTKLDTTQTDGSGNYLFPLSRKVLTG